MQACNVQKKTGGSFLPTRTQGWETLGAGDDAEEGAACCPQPSRCPLSLSPQGHGGLGEREAGDPYPG